MSHRAWAETGGGGVVPVLEPQPRNSECRRSAGARERVVGRTPQSGVAATPPAARRRPALLRSEPQDGGPAEPE